jgi:general secretion pathway protein M
MNLAIQRLGPSQQRALAALILALLVIVALMLVVVPTLLLHRHYDEAIADLTDRLHRFQRIAAQAPEYRRALDAMRERDARRFLLKNTAANLAGAELQELVRAAVEGNGGRITTSQNQPAKDEGRFRQITVNLQFFATTQNLQKILYALEAQQPYVLIDNLAVRPMNAFRGFRPTPGMEPENNVQMDVTAYSVIEPDKGAAGPRTSGTAPAGAAPTTPRPASPKAS